MVKNYFPYHINYQLYCHIRLKYIYIYIYIFTRWDQIWEKTKILNFLSRQVHIPHPHSHSHLGQESSCRQHFWQQQVCSLYLVISGINFERSIPMREDPLAQKERYKTKVSKTIMIHKSRHEENTWQSRVNIGKTTIMG